MGNISKMEVSGPDIIYVVVQNKEGNMVMKAEIKYTKL